MPVVIVSCSGSCGHFKNERTSQEWLQLSAENTPIAPVNTTGISSTTLNLTSFKILPHETHGADMLAFPCTLWALPGKAPTVGEHTEEVP